MILRTFEKVVMSRRLKQLLKLLEQLQKDDAIHNYFIHGDGNKLGCTINYNDNMFTTKYSNLMARNVLKKAHFNIFLADIIFGVAEHHKRLKPSWVKFIQL